MRIVKPANLIKPFAALVIFGSLAISTSAKAGSYEIVEVEEIPAGTIGMAGIEAIATITCSKKKSVGGVEVTKGIDAKLSYSSIRECWQFRGYVCEKKIEDAAKRACPNPD